ncbi:MAG: hypothetical protein DA328_07035 [Nitrososphaeraceae archaeon]|nr:hypothetical protein [Nitrososphaeraceae archaeon]
MKKEIEIKTNTISIFLIILLVGGTFSFSLSSQFSFILEVQAQAKGELEYGYEDNSYKPEYYPAEYEPNHYNPKDTYSDILVPTLIPQGANHQTTQPKDIYPDIIVPTDFATIQSAIDAANEGDIIKVLPGTYTEQITINKSLTILGSGAKSTIIEAPPSGELEPNTAELPYIVEINNDATVKMKGLTIKGHEESNCDVLFGVTVLGDATLNLDHAVIRDCMFAGVLVGILLSPSNSQTGHATITNTVITDYQKYGVNAEGLGSTLTMAYNKIVGSNYEAFDTNEIDMPPNLIGIFFTNGAKATIIHNKVSGNICNLSECGPDWFNQFQAAGIGFCNKSFLSSNSYNLPINTQQEDSNEVCHTIGNLTIFGPIYSFIPTEINTQHENSNEIDPFLPFQAIKNFNTNVAVKTNTNSIISSNYLSNNDVGISVTGKESGCCIIDHNKLTENRFFGIVIADGEHTISNTKIFGGNVGVAGIATNANTVASLEHVKIVDAEVPVQALSDNGFTAAVNVISPYFLAP